MPGTKTISMAPSPMVWYAILTSPLTAYRVVGNTKSLICPRPACAILGVRSEKWRQSTLSTNWFAKPWRDHPSSSLSWDWSREHSKILDWSLDPRSVNGMVRPCSGPASMRSWQGALKTRSTPCLRNSTQRFAVIGIDIGKNSFHIVGHDHRGAIVLRQKWSRGQMEARLANLPPCRIGMEACVGTHHLSRTLKAIRTRRRP